MIIINTSGTMGDAYTNCCKLCDLKDEIYLLHSQPFPKLNNIISEIYSLVPNIVEVKFFNGKNYIADPKYPYIVSYSKDFPNEPEYIKMNYFPRWNIKSNFRYDFPYIILHPHAGRVEQYREMRINTIEKIIKNSKYHVILIGTSKKFSKINKNVINLINKTTLFDAFYLIQNAKYYIGVSGIMSMFALSQRINSNFIYFREIEMINRIYGTPWQKYSKKIVLLRDYNRTYSSVPYKINFILYDLYSKFLKNAQLNILIEKILKSNKSLEIKNDISGWLRK